MKAHGALSMIAKRMAHIGHWDDVVALNEYLATPAFLENFKLVLPKQRRAVFAAYMEAHEEARLRKPVRAASRLQRAPWTTERVEELKVAAKKHKGDELRVARQMGITQGAAGRAMRRHGIAKC